ncbi:MAG TPA: VWA domain-containing protein [Solirubrobacteraceae bacterium]|nr:VWA domain-containing protein [Solirubrobacteraceae bacterium]
MTTFTAEAYQNEYLPLGGSDVNAVVTVTATGGAVAEERPAAAEVVIVDASGSMEVPRGKIEAARQATAAAIDCIRDGVEFGVIAGRESANALYPRRGGLVTASERTRAEAKQEAARLDAGGGTAIGAWLRRAGDMFATAPEGVHHAILLTDGENYSETDADFAAALTEVEGRFQCDCRGVGADWKVDELRRVASTLLGSVNIIKDPSEMPADFRAMMEAAMGKATREVSLRLWTPRGATVKFVSQVAPTIEDLTQRGVPVNDLTADYPTGAWGTESRDYQICVVVNPGAVGDEMLAGRVRLVEGEEVHSEAKIRAIWTDDEQLSTRISHKVAAYTGQVELAEAIQDGLEARKAGDEATATFKLGRAVKLAVESGNDETMQLLQAVVEIDDPATGTVRLRSHVEKVDEMTLDTRSTKTVRVGPAEPAEPV